MSIADELSYRLDLPADTFELSTARTDKAVTGKVLRDAGIEVADQKIVMSQNDALSFFDGLSSQDKAVVIKPTNSAGTDGVTLCRTRACVAAAVDSMLGKLNKLKRINENLLIQEYLTWTEYAVNTVSANGVHIVTDIWEYKRTPVDGAMNVYDADLFL